MTEAASEAPPADAGDGVLATIAGRRVLVIDLSGGGDGGEGGRGGGDRAEGTRGDETGDRVLAGARAWCERAAAALGEHGDLATVAAWSGPALAAALHAAAARDGDLAAPAFTVTAGDAVRRGVPTAARATLTARAPLRPGLTEAQVGGPYGRSLAARADALVLLGTAAAPSVVGLRADGRARVEPAPAALLAEGTGARARVLAGDDARHVITGGPGADAGLPFANLASFDGAAPDAAPSVVGRGGLGAALASAGVVALTVESGPGPSSPAGAGGDASDLERALVRSPRLLSRASGGTLELAPTRATDLEVEGAREKHGCAGCPTPCGWSFQVEGRGGPSGAPRVGGRFSALQGFADRGDPLALLQRCNDLGVDARVAARLLAGAGDVDAEGFLDDLVTPGRSAHAMALAVRDTGGLGATFSRGDLAAEVGQAVAVRGAEPVRSMSVLGLTAGGLDPADREALLSPLPWTGDPEQDAGTLARWHECLAAAVDVSGFCAFSAAGLLADGVVGIDELGEAIAPRPGGWGAAGTLLVAGAAHLAVHEELRGGAPEPPEDLRRRHPAALEAYARARRGEWTRAAEAVEDPAPSAAPAAAAGAVRVLARGLLAARLAEHPERLPHDVDGEVLIPVAAPSAGLSSGDLAAALAGACPGAAPWLVDGRGRALPAVVPVGERSPAARSGLHLPGDEVELVLAIPGG